MLKNDTAGVASHTVLDPGRERCGLIWKKMRREGRVSRRNGSTSETSET